MEPTQIFQDHLPAQGQLLSNLNSPVPCNLTYLQISKIGHGIYGGDIILPTTAPDEIGTFLIPFYCWRN